MNTRRGASVGTVVMALAGFGAVGAAGWAVMTGTTPCDLIGACSTGLSGTRAGATLPASATVTGSSATPSCCELGALGEQTVAGTEPVAGEVIPASVQGAAGDSTHACTGEGGDPAGCEKGADCCAGESKAEDAPGDACCAGGEHG